MNRKATFVVLGGGIAGVSCAEQLSLENPDEDILLISASPIIKAARNVQKISERVEQFDIKEEAHTKFEEKHANVKVIIAVTVSIDPIRHEVSLLGGSKVEYQRLCICTGASPKKINTVSPYVLGIRDTETVKVFQKKLNKAKRVLVVGNGGIATELVYEIQNCEVIWAIKDATIGTTFFDAGAAAFFNSSLTKEKAKQSTVIKRLQYCYEDGKSQELTMGGSLGPDWCFKTHLKGKRKRSRKVKVEYKCEVAEILNRAQFLEAPWHNVENDLGKWPIYVKLTTGAIYGCDFVVSATGVIPNTSFLPENTFNIAEDGGIKVDSNFKTNVQDVFAAGDVCTVSWDTSAHWFQMRLWTQARVMGAFAAKSMAADIQGSTIYPDICFDLFTHVTKFFGYKVVLLGLFNGQKLENNYEIILRTTPNEEYIKTVLKDGRMVGAILIGETDLEETFENLILNELDISRFGENLLDPDVDIEDYFD